MTTQATDLRSIQRPLKDRYRTDAPAAQITVRASGSQSDVPMACSVDLGRAIYAAQAHAGVGGAGTAACSGDLLVGALVACAQLTCQMVAAAMGIPLRSVAVHSEGDLDLRGTLGISRDVPVGFSAVRLRYELDAPEATSEQLSALEEKTEQYCVVLQTLLHPPSVESRWETAAAKPG